MNIAVLGAPGCLGRNLLKKLLKDHENIITGSFMSENEIPKDIPLERLTWKQVNLLDTISAEQFLDCCETLIYLIHSLHADNFKQLDIQLANAAGTAAAKKGVKKIIYMGGIVPANQKASPTLQAGRRQGRH